VGEITCRKGRPKTKQGNMGKWDETKKGTTPILDGKKIKRGTLKGITRTDATPGTRDFRRDTRVIIFLRKVQGPSEIR